MATKTIPQLTAFAGTLTGAALFEISQSGSFKLTLGAIQDWLFTSNWTGNGNINITGGFALTSTTGISFEAIGGDLDLFSDVGNVVITAGINVSISSQNSFNFLAQNNASFASLSKTTIQGDSVSITDGGSGSGISTDGTVGDIELKCESNLDLNPTNDLLINGVTGFTGSVTISGHTITTAKGIITNMT